MLKASSSLVGTIIGAGLFGVPYVMVQAGFLAGSILFLALTAIMLVLHLMYAEVVDRSGVRHRLTGYMDMYFGKRAKDVTTISVVLAIYGSLIVYILLANEFLTNIFGEILSGEIYWGLIFWAILSIGIIKGIKTISNAETLLLGFLGLVLLLIGIRGLPVVEFSNFNSINLKNILLPYGVILFALGGFQAIPEMRFIIGKDGKTFKRSVIVGVLFSALATILFAFIVVGVSGETTSPEAISGLEQFLGEE
ncbi:MAG: aromatic amino acid transport family protein, partial [Candidatus Spechtbacterales bacterium]|nr:aromatic amino acid transport family protein [Candidatus Spechtbacterales bacterium]